MEKTQKERNRENGVKRVGRRAKKEVENEKGAKGPHLMIVFRGETLM